MSNHPENSTECCPKFDPAPWNEKTHIWKDKRFIQDEVCQIFHMPMNMGKVVTRMFSKIQAADAMPEVCQKIRSQLRRRFYGSGMIRFSDKP